MTEIRRLCFTRGLVIGALGLVLALTGLAPIASADAQQRSAQPRSSSGSGSSSARGSSSASRPSSGGRSSSSGGSRASGGSSGRSDGRSHRPTGNPSRGSGHRGGHGYYPSHGYGYYGGHSYYSLGLSFGYPYYGGYYGPYNYGYGYSYGYPYYGADRGYGYAPAVSPGALSLKIKPKAASVFLDGRYVGIVDGFDGLPRYLWVPAGNYTLTVVHEGYANLEQEVEVVPGQVVKFKTRLEPGVAVKPEPQAKEVPSRFRPADQPRLSDTVPVPSQDPPSRSRDLRSEPAHLELDIRPADASVYLDGRFLGTGREVSGLRAPLIVDAGEHVLQVIHPDFTSQDLQLAVGPGEQRALEVVLDPKG